jgi:hypothetical protein
VHLLFHVENYRRLVVANLFEVPSDNFMAHQLRKKGKNSTVRIATRCGLGRSGYRIPVGERFSAPVRAGPGAYPASYAMATGSFPGVKLPGRGVDHQLPYSAEVEGRVDLYILSPSGPS